LFRAIQNGDVEVLEWFAKEQKLVKVSDASLSFNFVIAIERDHLNVLEYAVRHGLALDPLFYGSAIREKNQRIIAFLEANHCPLDAYALAAAVSVKDRALLENLDEQKIPYNEFVASTAASMGDVDMLCYLIDVKRCPFGQGTLGASTVHSSLNTFLHLVEQVCYHLSFHDAIVSLYLVAASISDGGCFSARWPSMTMSWRWP